LLPSVVIFIRNINHKKNISKLRLSSQVNKGSPRKCILLKQNAILILFAFFLFVLLNHKNLLAQDTFEVMENEESAKKINKTEKSSRKIIKKILQETNNKDGDSSDTSSTNSTSISSPNIYDYSQDDVAGINALMMAVNNNDIAGVTFYSKAGSALINQKNIGGATPLHIASREGYYEIAKILIDNGADFNLTDNEGWTPLMRANINARDDIVLLLVTKGAQAGILNYMNESVIMHATLSNCEKCLNIMFEKINFLQNFSLKTLKEQITDSFIISRNRENPKIQGLLEAFLDRLTKVSPAISNEEFKKKMAQDSGNSTKSKIIEELINKDQSKNIKKTTDNSQALLVADFIDKNNQEKNIEKNITKAEIDKKIQASESKIEAKNNDVNNSLKILPSTLAKNPPINTISLNTPSNSNLNNQSSIITDNENNKSKSKKYIFKKIQEDSKPLTINDAKVFVLKPPANYQENSLKNINNQIPINDASQKPKFKIINELNEAKNDNKSNYKSTKNNNSKQLIVKTIKYNEEKKANINNQISNKISDTQNSKLISKTKSKNDSDSNNAGIDKASANLANDDRSEKSALIATSSENVKVQPKKFVIGILPDNQ
jgi:hypothetical protein